MSDIINLPAQASELPRAAKTPSLLQSIRDDIVCVRHRDPAARGEFETLLIYPGVHALIWHRVAHRLWRADFRFGARLVSWLGRFLTNIDIHPGAQIGERFFIDHGSGVVIGQTAIIGRNVRIYQAVTLGAKRFEADPETGALRKNYPRHPIVEDDVVIYAGATILGRVVIGKGSSIGGNVWLTHSVPPGSHITQAQV